MPNQYHPLSGEFVATGVIGILLYILIIYFAIASVKLGIKSKSTKRFFFSVIVMALLEIPRFLLMCINADYNSKPAYCFHILAGIFFFIAFSIVCRQWSGLLQLGSYFRAVYGRPGLIISNIMFAIVDFVAVVACGTATSLSSFFSSNGFVVITFIEGVRNCVYSIFLAYYGVKLVRRFWHFSMIERQASSQKNIFAYLLNWSTNNGDQDAVFTKVVIRLTSVLVLSSTCFVLRVCMLIAKMAAVHSSDPITTPTFTLFGFLWFCCADFIPRALPTLAFIFLMRTRRPSQNIKHSALHKTVEKDDFQFVKLADDDSFYNLSDLDRSNSISSTTEVMLNSDYFVPDSKRSLSPGDAIIGANTKHKSPGHQAHHSLLPHSSGAGQQHLTGQHTNLSTFDVEADDDTNDDDFYSLDDDEWNDNGEPTLIDRFFSAITFSATHKAADTGTVHAKGKSSKDGNYDVSEMRI